jgi:hypothetical protein
MKNKNSIFFELPSHPSSVKIMAYQDKSLEK